MKISRFVFFVVMFFLMLLRIELFPQAQLIQSFTEKNITGYSAFGSSVSSAGDLNADGYDDIVVGAPEYCDGQRYGRVSIYFGGMDPDTTADVTIVSTTQGRRLGFSVSGAGDFNSDGFDDIIVGSYGPDAYLYYGGVNMDNVPDVIFHKSNGDTRFGYNVSNAGDMNNDGYSDIMIAAITNFDSEGKVNIYFGNNSNDNLPDLTINGLKQRFSTGNAISSAGDLNNDEYDDIIIGSDGQQDTGAVYIFLGDSIPDNIPDLLISENGNYTVFGYDVSSAGDVNYDGYDDFLVNIGGNNTTRLYLGGEVLDTIPDKIIVCDSSFVSNGFDISYAGDLNNDGFSDFIIGDENASDQKWYATVYLGNQNLDSIKSYILQGNAYSLYIDQSVSSAGDFNNDGFDDIIIGIGGFKNQSGIAYMFLGKDSPDEFLDYTFNDEGRNNYFGVWANHFGDINNDGYDDIILSAGGYDNGKGAVYYYLGSEEADNTADIVMYGDSLSVGSPVCFAGDLNNDSYEDYILSCSNSDKRIYLGGTQIDTIPDLIINNGSGSINFAGDLNSDGYNDLVFGQPEYNSTRGRIYIYFGSDNIDAIPDLTITPVLNAYHDFGCSVSTAGDLNNDGYDDLIVGAQAYNSYKGRAFIYYGGALMDTIADIILDPIVPSSWFGSEVSNAGDVNNDGYDDILVSAIGYNNFNGTAYLFYGGSPMDAIRDLEFNQGGYDWSWGLSTISAGDINNDSYDDIMIAGSSNCPFIRIYYGGSNMDSTPDLVITGEYPYSNEISEVGDFNNDGYADILVGNSTYNNNGKVWLYTDPGAPLSIEYPGTGSNIITEFHLEQNYPNPFNPFTVISYQLPVAGNVILKVFDVLGKEIATLVNEEKSAGNYEIDFNASSLSSGIYFYRLQAGSFVQTKKMILLK